MRVNIRGPGRFVLIPDTAADEEIIDLFCKIRWETDHPIETTYIEAEDEGCLLEFDLVGGEGDVHAGLTKKEGFRFGKDPSDVD